ncbi:MAG: type II toxin-antitoxin system YafQ family toxin [Terracidiphilus sp.]|nr:type II toxin-antitoxin system YafQ family toxin [Terracidiphilus sp.]MDR3799468.1 type II toxin-antitoxin system YafQ family toxin [Terracidiphilus sp.]
MRKLKQTAAFKRDFKRERKGPHRNFLFENFETLIQTLANDERLEERHRDHPLGGEWKDHRDCHLRPDLVLIYRKPDKDTLHLVRLGSHSELFKK